MACASQLWVVEVHLLYNTLYARSSCEELELGCTINAKRSSMHNIFLIEGA